VRVKESRFESSEVLFQVSQCPTLSPHQENALDMSGKGRVGDDRLDEILSAVNVQVSELDVSMAHQNSLVGAPQAMYKNGTGIRKESSEGDQRAVLNLDQIYIDPP
jgi:hypothetical protein